jgi:Ni/Fe-hydrogenase subunit HybB-like protein
MNVESAALDGAIVNYSISFLEVVQALGVAAIVAIVFMLGIRVFAMVPTEALMEEEAPSPTP